MKLINTLLPLAAVASAFVIPDEQVAEQVFLKKEPQSITKKLQGTVDSVWASVEDKLKDAVTFSENALDSAINAASRAKSMVECHSAMIKWDIEGWLDSAATTVEDIDLFDGPHHPPEHPPHQRPGRPPHRRPRHPGHGDGKKPNLTVYELIAGSKYTTKLAKLIDEFPDLVEALNGTKANYTVFAPTDKAFKKIPDHGEKPPKELIKKVLQYHVSPDFYPAGRVLVSHTIPTTLKSPSLGDEPQRLRVSLGLKGLAVNFYSRIVATNIFGTNGVIHGVDSLLLPPPPTLKIIELLPSQFSTLQLALLKTGLAELLADAPHTGGTFFAPSNLAFQKLGPKINAFLFSKYGQKYLKALLEYHIVANQTLYSDAFYKAKSASESYLVDEEVAEDIPKGHFHIDLPTLLADKSLSIDIARWGGFITIKINGFNSIAVQDGLAKDGVIHIVSSLLIPPKTPGGTAYMGEEMDLEDFKARFDIEERYEEL
ncbi:Fasciclin domain-containing protein [Bisporella sp. PMI_857]|nr:Fasciclin domain-containing protein [Bisporella sp. PMI_857]